MLDYYSSVTYYDLFPKSETAQAYLSRPTLKSGTARAVLRHVRRYSFPSHRG